MINKWVLKAVVQKGISFLPMRDKINLWFQKNITKGVFLDDDHFNYKIKHASDHIRIFKKNPAYRIEDSVVMEIGTGWYPIVPISLFLSGVHKILSIDLNSYLTKDSLLTTIDMFIRKHQQGELDDLIEMDHERWNIMLNLKEESNLTINQMCERLHLETKVGDLSQQGTISQKVEFICSNNTFEHIYPQFLSGILKNCKSIMKSGGTMSHFIDMSDHFAHFDKSINVYNFLKFSKKRWQLIDNSIQPQNRMRLRDFKNLYHELEIPISEEVIWPYNAELLKTITIHPEYSTYSEEELGIIHAYLISDFS